MPTYYDLEQDRKRDDRYRRDAVQRKTTRYLTDPNGWVRDQKITSDNRKKAMDVGKALGLSEERVKQHISDQFMPNMDIQFSDASLMYCIEHMVKEAKTP